MTCPICGRWAPADRDTGYNADDVCPDCVQQLDAAEVAVTVVRVPVTTVRDDDELDTDDCPF